MALTHDITRDELEPGDHIYVYRAAGVYTHHGIFVGGSNDTVIHYIGGENKRTGEDAAVGSISLVEFLDGGMLRRYKYDISKAAFILKFKGTCCTLESDPASLVVARARFCLNNNELVPSYDVVNFNCESLAKYCKLGMRFTELSGIELMGQSHKVLQLPFDTFGPLLAKIRRLEEEFQN